MLSLIFRLFFPALLFVGGIYFLSIELSDDGVTAANAQRLVSEGKRTVALLDSGYTETTLKIKRSRTKMYDFHYAFKVDGKVYGGKHTQKEQPTADTVGITYLPSDPSINAVNPASVLESEQSTAGIWLAALLALAGAALGTWRWYSWRAARAGN